MADEDTQDVVDVAELDPEVIASETEVFGGSPDDFDEDTYLQAFPDVAQAIADGSCSSALQHYMDHGRYEDRISTYNQMRWVGRKIEAHIDIHGYNSLAVGWLFCGWSAEQWDESKVSEYIRDHWSD